MLILIVLNVKLNIIKIDRIINNVIGVFEKTIIKIYIGPGMRLKLLVL